MKPYYEHAGITIYHASAFDILPNIVGDVLVTDPPYGVRSEHWDDMDSFEFAGFTMRWLGVAQKICREAVIFGTWDGPLKGLCELLYPRVRTMVWDKPIGSQYAGSSERGMWFASEAIFHCYHQAADKTFTIAETIKRSREAKGMSRGAVDIAVRGKKTGLCFRWEEAACLPTMQQAEKIAATLSIDESSFMEELSMAYQGKAATAESRDVFSYRTEIDGSHPCQKPLGMMRDIIRSSSQRGSILVDPFMGSGTTLVAARGMGRKAVGIEREEQYCEIAAKRLSQETLFGLQTENVPAETPMALEFL